MNFLIVGLGSMGKRRIRCLKALNHTNVFGFDLRADRAEEANTKYSVPTFTDFKKALATARPSCLIISVPPHVHHIYMKEALELNIPFFVEASVTDQDMGLIARTAEEKGIVAAPSATLMFHPAIQTIQQIIKENRLGKLSNLLFHSGQYLPDWHTYEKVSDYYVSNPETGGAREIVPFELTWLTQVFGFPQSVTGHVRKTIPIEGADKIDDTYNCLLDYGDWLANITVDCVSRYATRRLVINGEKGQLVWSWDTHSIQVFDPAKNQWEKIEYKMAGAEKGYNANIGENMYIDELNAFIQAVQGKQKFPNTLERDHDVLKVLYAVEQSQKEGRFIELRRR